MSYEIIRSIQADKAQNKIVMRYASNNCTDAYGRLVESTGEWMSKEGTSFEEKIREIFRSDLDGCIQITSACGKFYKVAKTCREWSKRCATVVHDLPDADYKYRLSTYSERADELAKQAANLYFNKPIFDIDAFVEEYARSLKEILALKDREYAEQDKVAIRSASSSSLYKGYIVGCDFDNNLYLFTKEQYQNLGVLEKASTAIKIEAGRCKYLPSLYSVLAGNFITYTSEELISRLRSEIDRAARSAELDEIYRLLSFMALPETDILPWRDFGREAVAC